VLDEPTNDLDVETLELLEEQLIEYKGTLLLVSHDREFLNNIVTSTLVLEGQGRVGEYIGGYDDWLRQRPPVKSTDIKDTKLKKTESVSAKVKKKLSFKQERELSKITALIESLEKEQLELQEQLADPNLYRENAEKSADLQKQLTKVTEALEDAMKRWEELESLNH